MSSSIRLIGIIACFALLYLPVSAQERTTWKKDDRPGVRIAYTSQVHSSFELSMFRLAYSYIECSGREFRRHCFTSGWHSYGLGLEIKSWPKPMIGPQLYSEFHFAYFSAGIKAVGYTNFKRIVPVFTPRAGISIAGYFGVFYGYNVQLPQTRFPGIGKHSITVFISFIDALAQERSTY